MAPTDFRAAISAADFSAIRCNDDFPHDDYFTKLVDKNEKFRGICEQFPGGYGNVELIRQLTAGQQLLILLYIFDGQVCNGGITQFFWNYPEYIFPVRDAIERLGDTAILHNYERALETLIGKKERWSELYQECYANQDSPDWEDFLQTYDLLDLEWFEDAYFDKRGRNDKDEFVTLTRGLQHRFLHRLAEYIRGHRSEFIEE